MFERIVVPLDGTPFAEAALAPARALARMFHARLLLTRAVSPSGLPYLVGHKASDGSPMGLDAGLDAVDDADGYLATLTRDLQDAGFAASYLLFIAEPRAGIANAAELSHADLIVMATHRRWTLDLTRGDSMTLQVLARSRAPILAWRPGATLKPQEKLDGEAVALPTAEAPIVAPLDGSHLAEGALPLAEELARAFGSHLVLVRAVGHEGMGSGVASQEAPRYDPTHDLRREAQTYLDGVAHNIEARGVHASTVVRAGTPPSVIQAVAGEQDAALVVMASHGSRGEAIGFLGSVAGAMVEEGKTAVLVVRA